MNNTSPFLSGPLRTHTFRPQRSQSTRSAGIPGSLFPTMSSTGVPEVALGVSLMIQEANQIISEATITPAR
jgi:hypothetical protein